MSEPSAPNGWILLLSVSNEIDAHLKKGFLEQEGIRVVIESSVYRPRSEVPLYSRHAIFVPARQRVEAETALKGRGLWEG